MDSDVKIVKNLAELQISLGGSNMLGSPELVLEAITTLEKEVENLTEYNLNIQSYIALLELTVKKLEKEKKEYIETVKFI